MKRRSAIALVVVVALLLLVAVVLHWAMRPQVLGPRVMALAGQATGLDISANEFDYRLRGSPQLVARGVSARIPGAPDTVLEAERVLVSVPWSTLRSRGADPVITRIEVDAPRIQLQPALEWWASRPRGDGPPPVLAEGLHVRRGTLQADTWSVGDLSIRLPRFAQQARLGADIGGRYQAGSLSAPFHLHLAMTRPGMGAGIGVAGTLAPQDSSWRLPTHAVLSTHLKDSPAAAGVQLSALRLSASSRLVSTGKEQPFALGLAGEGAFAEGAFTLQPAALVLRGQAMIPRLQGRGHVAVGHQLELALTGQLERWPATWPELPSPIGDSDAALPFELDYRGASNLSDPLLLRLTRDQARFEGRLRVGELGAWMGDMDSGSPLPPLDGHLSVPRVDIAGAVLHGVEITIEDAPAATGPEP
ncbi:hypothetical protein [Luteimonas sp. A478]